MVIVLYHVQHCCLSDFTWAVFIELMLAAHLNRVLHVCLFILIDAEK